MHLNLNEFILAVFKSTYVCTNSGIIRLALHGTYRILVQLNVGHKVYITSEDLITTYRF